MWQFLGLLGGKRNRNDAADNLTFNVHHLLDSNLVKKVQQIMGVKKRHGLLDFYQSQLQKKQRQIFYITDISLLSSFLNAIVSIGSDIVGLVGRLVNGLVSKWSVVGCSMVSGFHNTCTQQVSKASERICRAALLVCQFKEA